MLEGPSVKGKMKLGADVQEYREVPQGERMGQNKTYRESPEAEGARPLHVHSLVANATPHLLFR